MIECRSITAKAVNCLDIEAIEKHELIAFLIPNSILEYLYTLSKCTFSSFMT
ncbi:hypothetical protein GCM10026983_30840 [Gracilibacillus alcaliphilus]